MDNQEKNLTISEKVKEIYNKFYGGHNYREKDVSIDDVIQNTLDNYMEESIINEIEGAIDDAANRYMSHIATILYQYNILDNNSMKVFSENDPVFAENKNISTTIEDSIPHCCFVESDLTYRPIIIEFPSINDVKEKLKNSSCIVTNDKKDKDNEPWLNSSDDIKDITHPKFGSISSKEIVDFDDINKRLDNAKTLLESWGYKVYQKYPEKIPNKNEAKKELFSLMELMTDYCEKNELKFDTSSSNWEEFYDYKIKELKQFNDVSDEIEILTLDGTTIIRATIKRGENTKIIEANSYKGIYKNLKDFFCSDEYKDWFPKCEISFETNTEDKTITDEQMAQFLEDCLDPYIIKDEIKE